MAEEKMTGVEAVFKAVEGAPPDRLRELLEVIVTRVMGAEVSALCGAGYGERSAERVNARNGYRSRPWDTRLGTIERPIPINRGCRAGARTPLARTRPHPAGHESGVR